MRERIKINQDWKFLLGDNSNSHSSSYRDDLWEVVCLPHTVQVSPTISSGNRNYQGICRYRKSLFIEKKAEKETLLLEFEAAMQVMELWVNDVQLSTHYCGFTTAVYDITDYIKYDEENIIAVRLDNSDNAEVPPGKPQGTLDFTYEGGMYKSVYLQRLPYVHVTNPILENVVAGGGIFVSYEDVGKNSAKVNIKTHVKNTADDGVFLLKHSVVAKDGTCVASCESEIKLSENTAEHCENSIIVENPELWSPFAPNLYTLKTEILDKDVVIDSSEIAIGIRSLVMNDKGCFINDEKIALSGGNYHMTFGQIGNAMSDNLLRRDARKLREAGMLSLRSHYPFPDAFLDECDKVGITVIVSNPGWQFFREGIFVERACQNMRDIVRKIRNHPSIVLWEPILNESHEMTEEFELRVCEITHEEYPYKDCYTATDSGLGDVTYKWSDKRGYGPKLLNERPEVYEAIQKRIVGKARWTREYGDGPDNFVDHNTVWRTPRAWGEDMMVKQVRRIIWEKNSDWYVNYSTWYNDKTIAGYGMWPSIEHNRGYHMNPCYGGFLDLQRIPKYSFYFFKSQRLPSDMIENIDGGAMIFIANTWSELSPDDITVYSNCDTVRLYHEGKFIEERKAENYPIGYPPFVFKNDFYYGRGRTGISVEGLIDGEVVATDARFSPGVTRALKLEADYEGIDMVADGSDILFVRCTAIDDNGSYVPLTLDAHDIVFTVEGEAKIIGDTKKRTELGVTGILLQSTKKAGKIVVKAQLEYPQTNGRASMENGKLEIYSKEV